VRTRHKVTALRKQDIPSEQYDLRMGERRPSEKDDFIWAFACYQNDPGITATELAPFGPLCAGIAIIIWEGFEDIANLGVYTEEQVRGAGLRLFRCFSGCSMDSCPGCNSLVRSLFE
jgi:hypothetical protein